jgi:SOUL heme-binding protein
VLSSIVATVGRIGESVLSIGGVRIGTEEPPHSVETLADHVQIRRYGPRITAEVTIPGDEQRARSDGFRLLARYIFGANRADRRIAMTAPVAQKPEPTGEWTIRFYLPAKWTMTALPEPDDRRVRLVQLPAETFAVLRFTGDRSPAAIAAHVDQLRETLWAYGFESVGTATAWFYDPPWTLPFRRRNEVAIPIGEEGS